MIKFGMVVLLFILSSASADSQDYQAAQLSLISSASSYSEVGERRLHSSIGEPVVSYVQRGDRRLNSGFLQVTATCVTPELSPDDLLANPGESVSIDVLINDRVPGDRIMTIKSISPENATSDISIENNSVLNFDLIGDFREEIRIVYELCDMSCDECTESFLLIRNAIFGNLVATEAFTPNGDGENDELRFTLDSEIPGSELWVYNRWGQEIFYQKNYTNNWTADGYPDGVYYYVLEVSGLQFKKSLTIAR